MCRPMHGGVAWRGLARVCLYLYRPTATSHLDRCRTVHSLDGAQHASTAVLSADYSHRGAAEWV